MAQKYALVEDEPATEALRVPRVEPAALNPASSHTRFLKLRISEEEQNSLVVASRNMPPRAPRFEYRPILPAKRSLLVAGNIAAFDAIAGALCRDSVVASSICGDLLHQFQRK